MTTDEDDGVAAWSALLRTHAAVLRVIEREVDDATGLPLSWYDVLLELDSAEGGRLRMQQVAERVVLSRTRISRLVDDLVRAGLVAKEPDPEDGRATLATITTAGRAARRRAAPVYLAGIQEHFAGQLTARELTTIRRALGRVLAEQHDR